MKKSKNRKTLRAVVEELLERSQPFSMLDVTRAAGVSRQAVHGALKPLIMSQRVRVEGLGRATRYWPASTPDSAFTRSEKDFHFWAQLQRRCPFVRVIPLATALTSAPTLRSQVEPLLLGLSMTSFVVFDFKGFDSVGPGFARAVVEQSHLRGFYLCLLNASVAIQNAFDREEWWWEHKPYEG